MMTTKANPVIEGPFLKDLLHQPCSLAATIAGLHDAVLPGAISRGLADGRFSRVVLTGMGSSFHALYPLHLSLARRGVSCVHVEAAELIGGFDGVYHRNTLLVVVSQSGESAEIVQLMKRSAEFGHVIAVTNDGGSTLSRAAGTTFLMHAGPEATVSCKTYIATLAVLQWLDRAMTDGDQRALCAELEAVGRAMAAYLTDWRDHVAALAAFVRDVDCVFVTARGASLATAGTGGLILKESTTRSAEGMSCAAFRHGPLEMANDRALVLIFTSDDGAAVLNRRLYKDILAGGGRAVLIGDREVSSAAPFRLPSVPAALRPIVEILPVQMLALAITARDGREAGRFSRASKITTTD